jgi:hypothetical protein
MIPVAAFPTTKQLGSLFQLLGALYSKRDGWKIRRVEGCTVHHRLLLLLFNQFWRLFKLFAARDNKRVS